MIAVDLFAGPGGWSVAAERLGIQDIGIEFDQAAVDTRRAAGFTNTIHGDVRSFGPDDFPDATMLIASPPCQTFSMAGKGAGRKALDTVLDAVLAMGDYGSRYATTTEFEDERTALVLEPLRWALEAAEGRAPFYYIALEQVPAVLPVWEVMADVLREHGYSVATGVVNAEQYGVPQTRRRAILVATLDQLGTQLPAPTHSRYHRRTPDRLDPGVQKWVTMAEALGWSWQRWMTTNDKATRATVRAIDEPAPTITAGHDSANRAWTAQPTGFQKKSWAFDRPSTTIVGSFRPDIVAAPGYRKAGDGPRQNAPGSVKVTIEEAATIQTFPADYPWQGSKSKQFQQVGNAIPPLLAEAILKELTK